MKKILLLFCCYLLLQTTTAQSVGIGITTPNSSSILHLNSTTKGFLPPVMTEAQRLAIPNPPLGLMVFQSDGADGLWINKSIISTLPIWRQATEGEAVFGPAIANSDNIRSLKPGGVVIGSATMAACAKLQITSTTGGVLFPRMTNVNRSDIPSPLNGLMVYDNTYERFYVQQNDQWHYLLTDEFWLKAGDDIAHIGSNVGINVVAPKEKLDVGGIVRAQGGKFNMSNASPQVDFSYNDIDKGFIQLSGTDGENLRLGTVSANETGKIVFRTNGADRMFIDASGNVSIGGPGIAAGYKLAISGKLISEEVRVELRGDWPDYVFGEEYKLPSLEVVENFIRDNKHLPNIPSAKEIENNGLHLGEMQKKQMEKIEELTLYIIELNKRLEKLEKENESMKAKM